MYRFLVLNMATKELCHDEYCTALKACWNVSMNSENWFCEEITEWLEKKCAELGVPFPYVAYPFLSTVAYALGVSHVRVSSKWKEPVILYTLVSGRSGTNKSGSLATIQSVLDSIYDDKKFEGKQILYDSGTMEGLMAALKSNNSVLCAIDEFSTFLDSLDKNSTGQCEKSRYLSLWLGCSWRKNTKQAGLIEIESPRFQFTGFNQNFFLINLLKKGSHYDGFLPRFLVATPREVFSNLLDKINAGEESDKIDMECLIAKIVTDFFTNGCEFRLNDEALALFASYHDNDVVQKRKDDLFGDLKCAVLSKSISNVLRVSAVQCALRHGLKSIKSNNCTVEVLDNNTQVDSALNNHAEIGVITYNDMLSAISLVKYSVNCVISLIDSASSNNLKKNLKRSLSVMPEPIAIDREFLLKHRSKIQKIHQNREEGSNKVSVSNITKNHLYPQINKKNGKENANKFIAGMVANGVGKMVEDNKFFEFVDQENIDDNMRRSFNELNILQ